MESTGRPFEAYRATVAPHTQVYYNEWSAGVIDWCADAVKDHNAGGRTCETVPTPRGQPDWRRINRQTLSWNAAAAWWAYAYTQLSTLPGARVVGQDQLVAGPCMLRSTLGHTVSVEFLLEVLLCTNMYLSVFFTNGFRQYWLEQVSRQRTFRGVFIVGDRRRSQRQVSNLCSECERARPSSSLKQF